MRTKKCDADHCESNASFVDYCGAYVCWSCDAHVGLARCYCGWSRHGGDGRKELEDMGETIEPDLGVSVGDLARDAKDPHDIYS